MISGVVPDTGPLISLGLVGRLDLIDRFKGQILITDAVRTELLDGRPSAPEREALAAWITAGGNRLRMWKPRPEVSCKGLSTSWSASRTTGSITSAGRCGAR
ncbi:MAG: hypothetical protein OXI66_10635 [Boseongicola sp.]|nr:hypothetical protein [Boseongicola sp.]